MKRVTYQEKIPMNRGMQNENKLVIIAETGKDTYKKHLVNMTDWNMYVVEDLEGADVNKYKYEVNYMPESIIPWDIVQKKQV